MTLLAWLGTSSALRLLGDHLWQSTLCAIVAAMLALVLRKNRAQVRYALWLTASIKFLIPFGALAALGRLVPRESTVFLQQPQLISFYEVVGEPFSQPELQITTITPAVPLLATLASALPLILLTIWIAGSLALVLMWVVRWRRVAILARDGVPIEDGPTVETLRRLERLAGVRRPITVVSTDASIEPGVFGILRAALLWPRAISQGLTDRQVEAILAHEVSHVRRHDNVAAALHMFVQALFWFHPLVWWLGARLIDERERACDEDVIRLGSDPEIYAESILKTCQLCIESPIPCVAGVTGSDLKKRIESIMSGRTVSALASWKKLLLATAGIALVAAPVAHGMRTAMPVTVQTQTVGQADQSAGFEVASIKPSQSSDDRLMSLRIQPGGRLIITNAPLRVMIRNAYRLQDFQIVEGPDWVGNDRFDITAKAEGNPTGQQMQVMLRSLLAERFKLTVHQESRDLPIYALTTARTDRALGPQIKQSTFDCAPTRTGPPQPAGPPGGPFNCGFRVNLGTMTGRGSSMPALASALSTWVNRIVLDRTGLNGDFDLDLKWTPDQLPQGPPPTGAPPLQIDPNGPSIFTALQEQLGLKLEPQQGPVDVLVIDGAERPTTDFEPDAAPPQPAQSPRPEPFPQAASSQPPTVAVSQPPTPLEFEVASVKRTKSFVGGPGVSYRPGSQFAATNVTLRRLAVLAYQVQEYQLDGLPSWNRTAHFDVIAKDSDSPFSGTAADRMAMMLRSLLADRFKLTVRKETRELPIFALVRARNDSTLGPQLHPSNVDCDAVKAARSKSVDMGNATIAQPGQQVPCAAVTVRDTRLTGWARTMSEFAEVVAFSIGRKVVDKTGMPGRFDMDLEWTPDLAPGAAPRPNSNGLSIYAAVQEQLGLKLESTKGPVDVLVIEHVEMPTLD